MGRRRIGRARAGNTLGGAGRAWPEQGARRIRGEAAAERTQAHLLCGFEGREGDTQLGLQRGRFQCAYISPH